MFINEWEQESETLFLMVYQSTYNDFFNRYSRWLY